MLFITRKGTGLLYNSLLGKKKPTSINKKSSTSNVHAKDKNEKKRVKIKSNLKKIRSELSIKYGL